jgi:uncharacterized RDD family membrane protein YckC/cytoskeletal protein CcmA (bactofilin family)
MKTSIYPLISLLALGWCTSLPAWADLADQTAPQPAAIQVLERVEGEAESGQSGPSREIVAVGKNVTLNADDTCKEIVTISGHTTVNGTVNGDVVVVAGSAEINGRITGDLVVVLGSAKLGPNAVVHHDVVVVGGPLDQAPGARIEGRKQEISIGSSFLHFHPLSGWFGKGLLHGRVLPLVHGWWWGASMVMVLLYVLIVLLFPRPVEACVQALDTRPVASLFAGILIFLLLGPLLLLLVVSGFGLFLIPFLICALVAAAVMSKVTVYTCAGQHLGTQLNLPSLQGALPGLLTGVVVFYLLYLIPLLGFVVWGLVATLGLGAVLLAFFAGVRKEGGKPNGTGRAAAAAATVAPAVFSQPISPPPPGPTAPAPPPTADPMVMNLAAAPAESPAASAPAASTPEAPAGSVPQPTINAAAPSRSAPPPAAPIPPVMQAGPAAAPKPALDVSLLPRAGFWIRLCAVLLDVILIGAIIAFLDLGRFFLLLWAVYHVAMWTWRGTTIGGVVLGLKIVRLDGRPLGFGVALVRSLASFFSALVLGLGFFWAGWDPEKQSWHDKIAGTLILKTPKGMPLI